MSREQTITELIYNMAGIDKDESFHSDMFEDVQDRIKLILDTYDGIDRVTGIPLKEKTEDGFNYTIKVHRPDGVVVNILIPVEGDCKHYDDLLKKSQDAALGLNLVTEGHYT